MTMIKIRKFVHGDYGEIRDIGVLDMNVEVISLKEKSVTTSRISERDVFVVKYFGREWVVTSGSPWVLMLAQNDALPPGLLCPMCGNSR